MEYKQAANILAQMLKKHKLDQQEKEALSEAIGFLSWAYLYKNRIKAIKAKRQQK